MDQELKQRLIGASVIIALAIIFVPMLFDGDVENKNNQNISINIPDAADNNLEVKKFDLDQPVTAQQEMPAGDTELVINAGQPQLIDQELANPVTAEPETTTPAENIDINDDVAASADTEDPQSTPTTADATDVQQDQGGDDTSSAEPQQTASNNDAAENVTDKPPTITAVSQAYRVKLGSFSQPGNAEKVKNSLLQKNIKSMVEFNAGLNLYRVWSQEIYQSEAQAQKYVQAVGQLQLNIGTPKVVALNANEVSQMASQQALGWVVQLGSFSDQKNAIELRNKVKAAGFTGFVDQITTAAGKQLYRLRIGPLMEKSDAEQTQAKIKSQLKLDGLIKSHELGRIVD